MGMNVKIAVDAGHGSNTAGKRTPDGDREHWFNVKTALYFTEIMEKLGFEIFKVGFNDANATDDDDIPLKDRQRMVKSANCKYSVSFHANAYGDGKTYNDANGISTHISDKDDCVGDSYHLAKLVQAELVKNTPQKDRGVVRQALSMANCKYLGTIASILIETAFMTNKREAELLKTDEFCKECATETAIGFCKYLGVEFNQTTEEPPKNDSSFKVKILADDLNIRKTPSILGKKVGVITDHGIYTIVEVQGNWGRLKSGAGWISINSKYVRRV